jgi:YbbR domain-containing protein
MTKWLINSFWIKIVSLILAVITWFYVNEELIKEKQITKRLYKSSTVTQVKSPTHVKKPMNKGYVREKR